MDERLAFRLSGHMFRHRVATRPAARANNGVAVMILRDGCKSSRSVDGPLDAVFRYGLLQFCRQERCRLSHRATRLQGLQQNLVINSDVTLRSDDPADHHSELFGTDEFTGSWLKFFLSNDVQNIFRIQLDPVVRKRRSGM
jgi:hypothetical protein